MEVDLDSTLPGVSSSATFWSWALSITSQPDLAIIAPPTWTFPLAYAPAQATLTLG